MEGMVDHRSMFNDGINHILTCISQAVPEIKPWSKRVSAWWEPKKAFPPNLSEYPLGKKLIFSVQASKFLWIIYYLQIILGTHWIIVPEALSEPAGLCLCYRSLAINCKKILPFLLFLPRFFDFIFYLFLNFSYRHQYRAGVCGENNFFFK